MKYNTIITNYIIKHKHSNSLLLSLLKLGRYALLLLILVASFTTKAATYYWVHNDPTNGTQNSTDMLGGKTKHWSSVSGSTLLADMYATQPLSTDNIIIDNNSFSINSNTATINFNNAANTSCFNFDCSGFTLSGAAQPKFKITGTAGSVNIFGNLILPNTPNYISIQGTFSINDPGLTVNSHTVQTFSKPVNSPINIRCNGPVHFVDRLIYNGTINIEANDNIGNFLDVHFYDGIDFMIGGDANMYVKNGSVYFYNTVRFSIFSISGITSAYRKAVFAASPNPLGYSISGPDPTRNTAYIYALQVGQSIVDVSNACIDRLSSFGLGAASGTGLPNSGTINYISNNMTRCIFTNNQGGLSIPQFGAFTYTLNGSYKFRPVTNFQAMNLRNNNKIFNDTLIFQCDISGVQDGGTQITMGPLSVLKFEGKNDFSLSSSNYNAAGFTSTFNIGGKLIIGSTLKPCNDSLTKIKNAFFNFLPSAPTPTIVNTQFYNTKFVGTVSQCSVSPSCADMGGNFGIGIGGLSYGTAPYNTIPYTGNIPRTLHWNDATGTVNWHQNIWADEAISISTFNQCPPTFIDSVVVHSGSILTINKRVAQCKGINFLAGATTIIKNSTTSFNDSLTQLEVFGNFNAEQKVTNRFYRNIMMRAWQPDRKFKSSGTEFIRGLGFWSLNTGVNNPGSEINTGGWILQDPLIALNLSLSSFTPSPLPSMPGCLKTIQPAINSPVYDLNNLWYYNFPVSSGVSTNVNLMLVAGHLNTNNQNVRTYRFVSTLLTNHSKKLTLGSSIIDVYGSGGYVWGAGDNLGKFEIVPGTSHIYLHGRNIIMGPNNGNLGLKYNDVTFMQFEGYTTPGTAFGNIKFSYNTNFNNLTFYSGDHNGETYTYTNSDTINNLFFKSNLGAFVYAARAGNGGLLNCSQSNLVVKNLYSSLPALYFASSFNVIQTFSLAPGSIFEMNGLTPANSSLNPRLRLFSATPTHTLNNPFGPFAATYIHQNSCSSPGFFRGGKIIISDTLVYPYGNALHNKFRISYLNVENDSLGASGSNIVVRKNVDPTTVLDAYSDARGWDSPIGTPRTLVFRGTAIDNGGDWFDVNKWATITYPGGIKTISAVGNCVPICGDSVIFDNASFISPTHSVVISTGKQAYCGTMLWKTGVAGVFAGDRTTKLTICNSLYLNPSMTYSFTGRIEFTSSKSSGVEEVIQSSGKTFYGQLKFNSANPPASTSYTDAIWGLADDLNCSFIDGPHAAVGNNANIEIVSGILRTRNKNITAQNIILNSNNYRGLALGSSSVTLHGAILGVNPAYNQVHTFFTEGDFTKLLLKVDTSSITIKGGYFKTWSVSLGGQRLLPNVNGRYGGFHFNKVTIQSGYTRVELRADTINELVMNNFVHFNYAKQAYIKKLFANHFPTPASTSMSIGNSFGSGALSFSQVRVDEFITTGKSFDFVWDSLYIKDQFIIGAGADIKFARGGVTYFHNNARVELIGTSTNRIILNAINARPIYTLNIPNATGTSTVNWNTGEHILRKDSGRVCADYIDIYNVWATGNGGNYSSTSFDTWKWSPNAPPANFTQSTHPALNTRIDTYSDTTLASSVYTNTFIPQSPFINPTPPVAGFTASIPNSGRAQFIGGANADAQTNAFGWELTPYPPAPTITITTSSTLAVCASQSIAIQFEGVSTIPFVLTYSNTSNPSSPSIFNITSPTYTNATGQMTGYNSATGQYTFVAIETPTTSTQYYTGQLTMDRCFGNFATTTSTINVTINPTPSAVLAASSPTTICNAVPFNLNANATSANTYTLFPTPTGTASPTPMTSYTVGAAVNGSVTIAAGTFTAGSSPETYTVYAAATTSLGCTSLTRTPVQITINPTPSVAITSQTNVACFGNATGAVNYTATGGSGSGYGISPATSGLIAGTYNYTVTDANGCKTNTTTTITQPASALTAIASGTNNTNCITADGQVSTNPSGGTSGYSYLWSAGASTLQTVAGLTGGTYTVTVTDNNNCTYTTQATIANPSAPIITASSSTNTICNGNNVTITPSGGATTYSIIPSIGTATTGVTGATIITPTATTSYSVVGTNSTSCLSNTVTLNVNVNATPVVTIAATSNTICNGQSTTLNLTGASTYTLVNTGTPITSGSSFNPSANTTYTVIGSTAGCASANTQQLITVNALPSVTATASSASVCAGSTAILTAVGADTYTWTSGPTSDTYTVSSAGTYSVTGTNTITGCSNISNVTLAINALPVVTANASSTSICSGNTATLTAGGAQTYTWTSPASTNTVITVTPTAATIYTVNGTDANGCVNSRTVSVAVNATPTVAITAANNTICIGNSSALTLAGASTYTLLNDNTPITSGASVSPTTTTTYSIQGSTGTCTSSATQQLITVNALPVVTATTSAAAICSGNTATLTAAGATTYTWTSPASTNTVITVNATGNYVVTGTDVNNCTNTATVNLMVNPTPTVNISTPTSTICAGQTATLTAATANSYAWSTTSTANTTTVMPTGTTVYTVTGTNTAGSCAATAQFTVSVNPKPDLALTNTTSIVCLGDANGTATVNVTSGTSGYTYVWTGSASTSSVATALSAGPHTVQVTDAKGCKDTLVVNIAAPSLSLSTSVATATTGCSLSNGTATLTPNGGWNTSYTYVWQSNASTTNTATGFAAGTYTAQVTDANGCVKVQNFTISNPSTPTIAAVASNPTICSGLSTTITPSGAVSYSITGGAVSSSTVGTSFTVNPAANTTYSIIGTDASNCISTTATVAINVNTTPTVAISATNNTICIGNSSALTLTGATTYTLLNTNASITSGASVSPTTTTTYSIQGTTGTCTSSATQQVITVNTLPVITATTSAVAICSGNTATLTAGGASSYVWTSGPSTPDYVVATAGIYTVTGTDANTCVNTQTVSLSVNALPIVTATASSATICAGNTATLTAGGANSYVWTSGPSTPDYAVTTAGVYTVTGTDLNNCVNTRTVNLTVNALPVVTATASPATICAGNTTTLTAGGASLYNWTSGPATPSYAVNAAGVYTVTGIDGNNCSNTKTISVTVNALPIVTANSSSAAICANQTATLTAGGANTYTWTSGPTATTYTVNTANTYTVTGTDINGCINSANVSLAINPLPVVTAVPNTTAICVNQSATLTAGGAQTYTWTSPASTNTVITVNPTTTTSYLVMGTDGNNCVNTQTVTLMVNQLPTITASNITNVTCFGANNGSVNFTPAAGTPTYAITGTSVTGTSATGLAPADYTYSVTDAAGCQNTTTLSITQPTAALLTSAAETATNTSCTAPDGIATVTITGGTSGYTINPVSGSVVGNTITGLNTGAYTYTVTDANGCTAVNSVTIAGATGITSTLTAQSNVLCFGNNTASVSVSGLGEASGTYNYTLTNTGTGLPVVNNSTGIFTNLPAGTYSVNILGGVSNCVSSQNITITQPTAALSLTGVTANSVICNGGTALATATVAGGTGPYTYVWASNTNTTTTNTTSSVTYTAGNYSVDITDANGCTLATQNFTVAEAPVLTIASVATTTTGCGLANGTATINVNGGWNSSYTHSLNTVSQATNTINNLAAATYTADVTDALGCTTQTVFTITNPSTPTLSIASNVATICAGETATLTPTGAVSYSLNGAPFSSVTTETVNPSIPTVYNITGTDANSCTSASLTLTVNVNALPTVSIAATATAICSGQTATLTASGADTYVWSSSANTSSVEAVNPSAQTVYTAQGTNTLTGCISNVAASFTVDVNTLPTLAVASQTNVTCLGSTDGIATFTTDASSYTITPASTGLAAGTHTFTVINLSTTCSNTVSATIATPTASLAIASVATQTAACATANGSATITAVDGWGSPYTYSVNGTVATGSVVTGLQAGNHTAEVSDAMGCVNSVTFAIVNPNAPVLSIASNTAAICAGQSLTLTPTGAVSYTLTNPITTFTNNVVLTPGATTIVTITGTDASSCTSAPITVTVNVNALPTVSIAATATAICSGQTATLTANTTGTTIVNIYTWSTGLSSTNTETVSPTTPTIYSVVGTNTVSGCSSTAQSVTVNVNTTPTVAVASQTNVLCFGNNNGAVDITTSATTLSITPATTSLTVGSYTFTITDLVTTCTNTVAATIAGPTVVLTAVVNNTITNTSCATPNGAFTVTALGGTPNYTYNATNTNGVFVNQGTGTQNITVVDANGCTFTVSATIPGIATPSISTATQTNVLCNGGTTGAASINVINGTPSYTYTWSNNAGLNSNTQASLPSGSYTVTATDAGYCTVTQAFVITEPNAMNVITTNAIAPCVGQTNGSISIEISGGTPNYNVVWNPTNTVENISNTSTISNIGEGTYIVTVTDVNGCQYQESIGIKSINDFSCSFVIPEIFSPNGDGKNDTWEIKGLENYPNNNVTVFNRWGDQVFKAEPYKNDWDGTNTGDKSILGKGALPAGTYYFILDLGNGDKPITGYVQITK